MLNGNGSGENFTGIDVDSVGNIYVTYSGHTHTRKYDSTGNLIGNFGPATQQVYIRGGRFGGPSGNYYQLDRSHKLVLVNPSGTELWRTAGPVAMDEPDAPVPPRRSRTAAWVFDDEPPLAEEFDNKLDLARAFMDMGTPAAARAELETVLRMGGGEQREAARRLLTAMR